MELHDRGSVISRIRSAGAVRKLRGVPITVWAITALWCSLLLGATIVWPVDYGLDEAAHVDMAYDYAAHPFTIYGPGELPYSVAAIRSQHTLPGIPPHTRLAQAPIASRGTRQTFGQLGGHAPAIGSVNQMSEHPPIYYWLEAVVLRFPGVSSLPWDAEVWMMRLLSVAMMSIVPLMCWASARRLLTAPAGLLTEQAASKLALLAAAFPLTIPNLIRDGASVDNDVGLIATTSIVLYLCTRVLTGDFGSITAAGLSITVAAALLTKGFGLALPVIVLAAYLVGTRITRHREGSSPPIVKPVVIVAIGAVVGGLWWLRNIIDYHTVQPDGYGAAYHATLYGPPDYHGTLSGFLGPYMSGFIMRIWGEIGVPDSPSPGGLIIYGWLSLALIGLAGGLLLRSRPGARLRLGVLGLVPLTYLAITMEGSFSTFRKWSRIGPQAVQGRYIYAGVVALAVIFALGWFQLARPRLHARFAPIVVVGAILTNAAAWLLILRSWYAPSGDSGWITATKNGFHGLLRWSPVPSPVSILLVVILPAVTAIGCSVIVIRDALHWDPRQARPDPEPTGPQAGASSSAG